MTHTICNCAERRINGKVLPITPFVEMYHDCEYISARNKHINKAVIAAHREVDESGLSDPADRASTFNSAFASNMEEFTKNL